MLIAIENITVPKARRKADKPHIKELAGSIGELGLLNPITVDREYVLIAGLHRLEAVKMLGWQEVECTVSSLEGLEAELAEIDENIVRKDLSALEYGEILLRRKEIYETLHPETKAGVAQAIAMNKTIGNNVADKMSATSKTFVEDTAEKMGVDPRTVRRQIQAAKNLDPEAKDIIKGADAKLSRKEALELSRLVPEQQREAAGLLAAQEIRSVSEYKGREKEAGEPGATEEEADAEDNGAKQPEGMDAKPWRGATFREVVAELKDADKDCSGTPESFLEEYEAFIRKFHREIGWYDDPYYDTVYPCLSGEQLGRLREMTDDIRRTAEALYKKVERMRKNGK